MKRSIILIGCAMLAGCGSTGMNTDTPVVRPMGLGRPAVADVPTVQIVESGPASTGWKQNVSGTSCKNKMWDPEPSRDNAINLMKRQAAERGFNAVHSVKVEADPLPVAKNCWAAINATGVAFMKN